MPSGDSVLSITRAREIKNYSGNVSENIKRFLFPSLFHFTINRFAYIVRGFGKRLGFFIFLGMSCNDCKTVSIHGNFTTINLNIPVLALAGDGRVGI